MASKRIREASSSPSTPGSKRIRQEFPFSFSTPQWDHDVFLSFRGEDTRKNIIDHLYNALVQKGFDTFIDEEELKKGENISLELLKAIEDSRIAIIVFSRNYASSRWCLDELVKILQCRKTISQVVLPVFYDVDPSDVRNQTGSFAEAFARHEERFKDEMEKVESWKAALKVAANLSGWDLQNVANGHESKFIQGIVDEVMIRLNKTYLNVAKYPIGLDSRVHDISMLLNVRSNEVLMVGIYGMGGMGKTTIAKAVYNLKFNNFDGSSFLQNVREASKQYNGLVHLQEQLLCDVLEKRKLTISNIDRGINVIKERMHCKKVLIVLDDVDQLNQLNALAGNRDWFGLGSIIIITTRDKQLLSNLEVDEKYEAKEMNHDESLQLFSWHAFGQDHPSEDYVELSNAIVDYGGGLPLALEVLGSSLFEKRIPEWKSALEKLQNIPNDHVQEKLKISYDALDRIEKVVFLDIACFFIGMNKNYVIEILDDCGLFPTIVINVLVCKSLVKSEYNMLMMHDLLRDMGREIICQESPEEPGKRSRLWFQEDICNVLTKHTGTKAVEGLALKLPEFERVSIRLEAFVNMENLRLLQINYVQITRGYGHLFKELFPFFGEILLFRELRWLCWHGFNLKCVPTNFHLEKLVILDMQDSNIRQAWKGFKLLNKLKVLNLSHSRCLITTPDFLGLPSLVRLILEGCTSLVEIHPSIGHLDKLIFLNMKDCKNLCNLPSNNCEMKSLEDLILFGCSKLRKLSKDFLGPNLKRLVLEGCTSLVEVHESIGHLNRLVFLSMKDCKNLYNLPSSICDLKSLEEIILSGCSKLDKLPEDLGNVECLRNLSVDETAIKQLPQSIMRLMNLERLSLSGSPNSINPVVASLSGLFPLKRLILSDCNLSEISCDLGSLSLLEQLDLRNNNFYSLPSSISCLSRLMDLQLSNCTNLQSLPKLPSSIRWLDSRYCTSLQRLSNLSNVKSLSINLDDCNMLTEIQGLEGFESIPTIHRERFLQGMLERDEFSITLSGSKIPEWFRYQSMGSSLSFKLHPRMGYEIQGLLACAVYAADRESIKSFSSIGTQVDIQGIRSYQEGIFLDSVSHQDNIWVNYRKLYPLDLFEGGNQVDVQIVTRSMFKFQVKKCGVHVLYVSSENASTIKLLSTALEC